MKLLYTALTALPALASAKVLLAVVEFQSIAVGDTYNVEWLVDSKMNLQLWLIQQTSYGWNYVQTLFDNVESKPCNGSYQWVVDDTISPGSNYGLWIDGQNIPNHNHGYSSGSDWFDITGKDAEL